MTINFNEGFFPHLLSLSLLRFLVHFGIRLASIRCAFVLVSLKSSHSRRIRSNNNNKENKRIKMAVKTTIFKWEMKCYIFLVASHNVFFFFLIPRKRNVDVDNVCSPDRDEEAHTNTSTEIERIIENQMQRITKSKRKRITKKKENE